MGVFGPPELIFGIGFALLLRVCDMAAPDVFHNLRFVSPDSTRWPNLAQNTFIWWGWLVHCQHIVFTAQVREGYIGKLWSLGKGIRLLLVSLKCLSIDGLFFILSPSYRIIPFKWRPIYSIIAEDQLSLGLNPKTEITRSTSHWHIPPGTINL